jgi:hydroxyacylglutathione hydrolase
MAAIIPIPAFSDNYIWLWRQAHRAVVIDPGDAAPVRAYLEREGLALAAILNTHHHGDHVGGNSQLLAQWPVPVYGPAREAIPGRSSALTGGMRVDLSGFDGALQVLDVPGHTAGHIAYTGSIAGGPVAFVGDTLFAAGCGRLFEGTPAQMAASLARIAELPPATRVYCAHEYTLANLRFAHRVEPGNRQLQEREIREQQRRGRGEPTVPMTLADEIATNPFLRTAVPEVIASAAEWAGTTLADPVAVFAVLREWKNGFT